MLVTHNMHEFVEYSLDIEILRRKDYIFKVFYYGFRLEGKW